MYMLWGAKTLTENSLHPDTLITRMACRRKWACVVGRQLEFKSKYVHFISFFQYPAV